MSPKKRRPQARKGRTASAARAGGRKTDRTSWIAAGVILLVGILLVVIMRPSSSSAGVALGEHWHAALGVYACDKWDGDASWDTPVNPSTGGPVRVGSNIYAGLHSHKDGLIHMEPQTSDEIGKHATLGTYFSFNGFELSSSHVKFATADLKNGDKCGNATGKLHWLVNGKERTGNPGDYVLHDRDWIVVAFLPDSKTITSLGKPPSFANLEKQTGQTHTVPTNPPSTSTPSSSSKPTSTSAPTSTSTPTT
jgi:hypothetical protein